MNGDQYIDMVVANTSSTNVSVLLNNGDGTYATAINYGAGSTPRSVALGDVDGDLDIDIVVANLGSANTSVFFE